MLDFLSRNYDAVIIVTISVVLSFILNQYKEIFKLFKIVFRNIIKIMNFVKRRIKGQYNLNEMEKLYAKPENKLTKKQKKAVDKAKQQLKDFGEKMDLIWNKKS